MEVISNKTTVNFFTEKTSDDIKKIFIGVFPSNYVIKFISFHSMMTETGARYLFIIMNTDRSDKKCTHWWSFLDLHPKKEILLFDSFGFEDFKDDPKIHNKILHGIEKFNKRDNKITLITLKFSMQKYEKIKNMNRLSETTIDLLHLMNEYGKKHNPKNEVIVHLVDHHLQIIEKDTC